MKEENIKIKSNIDSLVLDGLFYTPKNMKAIVVIAHGMNEHKERYAEFLKFLGENDYATFIYDHRGHGRSIQTDGDLGYLYNNGEESLIEDLNQIIEFLKEKYPGVKIILMGHSMGSMVVRKYLAKYDKNIDGLIVCGSPSKNNLASLGLFIVKFLETFKGDRYRSNFVKKLMFGSFNIKGEEENSWICTNKEIVKAYNEDKLCTYTYTLNGYENIIKLMIDIYKPKIYMKNNLKLPIYFIAGEDDPVITNKDSFLNAVNFLKNLGYQNITYTLYKGKRHEILNEIGKDEVYNGILTWLNSATKK